MSHFLRFIGLAVWGVDLWPTASIGPGFVIAHPQGVVLGSAVVADSDLTLFSGVILGGSARHHQEWLRNQPRLGDHVIVGSNAVVASGISIGEGAVIGAGIVVLEDVQARSTVRSAPLTTTSRWGRQPKAPS